jgi:hypothetical protein
MSRRIEIELTSRNEEGAYTWRAAGARQPRGTLDPALVPNGASVGDVVRAEVESGLDGLEVVAVLALAEKGDDRATNRIEVIGTPRRGPDVSITYAPGNRRRREEREPSARTDRAPGRRPGGRAAPRRPAEAEAPERAREGRRQERPRPSHREREGGEGRPRPPRAASTEGRPAPARRERRPPLQTAHRNALLATLGPEQLPIAEQLLRGGIPAVRQALAEHSAPQAPAAATNNETVLSIAEQLLPRVNLATWKDRATAAQSAGRELRLRELRAVVTASRTVTLDDEARALARTLHQTLGDRVKALLDDWISRMGRSLDEGRVVDAVRLSARPPEPGTRLPAEVAVRLADTAGAAMTADTDPGAWTALLGAVVDSPVRRTVKPHGIPAGTEDVARRAAGSVPELARLLGLPIPPPPPPRRAPRVMAGGGGARAGGR